MSEDLKILESLSYRPIGQNKCNCERCGGTGQVGEEIVKYGRSMGFRECPDCQPTSASPATLGMNSAVIKPAKRVNKAEGVEQPNLKIIGEIESLISQVNEKLEKLPDMPKVMRCQLSLKRLALEEIDLFQKTTLHELRKELE